MNRHTLTPQEADAINEQMVRQMELRRQTRPERRQRAARAQGASDRRRICAFCWQPGDHPTPDRCLRALER